MQPQPTLTTGRLSLRPFQIDDAPELQRLAGAREVAEGTLTIPHPYPDGLATEFIAGRADYFASGEGAAWAITRREDGRLLGGIGLHFYERHARAEIGYWLGVPYWGRGYATEAAAAVLEYGFRQRGLHRIYASHFTYNPASGRVMQKLGMRLEGTLREHVLRMGKPLDLVYYGILRPEWEARVGNA